MWRVMNSLNALVQPGKATKLQRALLQAPIFGHTSPQAARLASGPRNVRWNLS